MNSPTVPVVNLAHRMVTEIRLLLAKMSLSLAKTLRFSTDVANQLFPHAPFFRSRTRNDMTAIAQRSPDSSDSECSIPPFVSPVTLSQGEVQVAAEPVQQIGTG